MKDTQSESDGRGVAIDFVGVSGLRWPIVISLTFGRSIIMALMASPCRLPVSSKRF